MIPHIRIITDKPVAFDSPDHIQPWGTARDNSVNLAFNRKLLLWIPASDLKVVDLGCAGGGFVKSILDQGCFAVGVEGSDYSKIRRRAEWTMIPDYLFTADITEPFQLLNIDENGQEYPVKFNVITAWEVMEHIRKDQLYRVSQNISRHLLPNGVIIMSISLHEDIIGGVRLHQTVETRKWWISKFLEFGFIHHESVLTYFGRDWVRGGINTPGSFQLVMTRSGESLPSNNRLRLLIFLIHKARMIRKGLSFIIPSPVKRVYHDIRDRQNQSKIISG